MKKTSFYWQRRITFGEWARQEYRHINATVTATANGFAVDLCESWNPEATQGMEPDELSQIRLRAIIEAHNQPYEDQYSGYDWEVETDPTPTHSDPDGEAIASALADLRADM